ncbi:MAG: HlyD family efflux transporter periplasmic adaptor subunit [Prolixibacteraceae bacterium]
MLKNKKILIPLAVITVIGLAVFISFQIKPETDKYQVIKKGNLEVLVNCNGEVKGEKYVEINMPDVLCNQEMRVYQYKIVDLVQEGKAVKKGDYIAKLDEGQLMNMMREQMQQKEKMDADLRNLVLDSTVNLSAKRENINNAKLDLEYLKIDLEQSKFESEAYQRKTRMSYQKAELGVDKIRRDYLLEKNRMKMQVNRFKSYVDQSQRRISSYQEALGATRITTPEDGIVMFAKDWSGKTYGKDTEINIWRPLIATLPDMSVAISETYIREIDISKVSVGDSVRIKIDALANRTFKGEVIKIATIGEDHKDFDMKAFKVIIRFEKSDKEMKPGMRSTNDIIIDSYQDRILVPMNAVFSKNGKHVIYLKKGNSATEQAIELVADNGTFGVVENIVQVGDVVLLYQPEEFKIRPEEVASR